MSRRILLTVLGVVGCVVFLKHDYYRGKRLEDAVTSSVDVGVVVAAHDVPVGVSLSAEDVRLTKLRVANLLPIHFRDESLVLGRITILPIPRGEILVPAELAEGCNPNLQLPNMRAVSVQIRTALEIPKSVESGSHLDLFVVRSSPDGKTHTNPVLKNVIVLGVTWHSAAFGSVAGQTPADVILLLSPDDAHKVAVAQSKGRIKLLASGVTSRHS